MGVTLSCVGSTKWWVEDVLSRTDYSTVFTGIASMSINGLIFLPYLIGDRSPINDPNAKGAFYGLNASHAQKHLTKAVVKGVCLSQFDCIMTANNCGVFPTNARVIGGGAKSFEWLQLLADVTGLTLQTIQTSAGGALGAIILSMPACGLFPTISEGCEELNNEEIIFIPDRELKLAYEEKYRKYKIFTN